MKLITWIFRIVLLLSFAWLALQNKQMVTFTVIEGLQIDMPLIALLLAFFVVGLILGVLMYLPKYWGVRWDLRKARKEGESVKTQLADLQKTTVQNTQNQPKLDDTVQTDLPASAV